jgi:hypothetical protein
MRGASFGDIQAFDPNCSARLFTLLFACRGFAILDMSAASTFLKYEHAYTSHEKNDTACVAQSWPG